MSFPYFPQLDGMDCGPTCLRMISKFYGKSFPLQTLRDKTGITREGVSLWGLSEAATSLGFYTMGAKLGFEQLAHEVPLPAIVHWRETHFIVVYQIKKGFFSRNHQVLIADPREGITTYSKEEFLEGWAIMGEGVALLLEPTPEFYQEKDEPDEFVGFGRLLSYLGQYKRLLVQLLFSLLAGSLLQLIFPFLAKGIVDKGVNTDNLNFIYLVLAAQLMLMAGRTTVEFVRSWILLHISSRINISLLSDFLLKLLRLPISFFDTKLLGDLLQRVNDQHRVEDFLTNTTLNTLFSLFNLALFGAVLAFFYGPLFWVFLVGSLMYLGWILLFLNQRKKLDFKRFEADATSSSSFIQLVQGMPDIKLANAETLKRWEWESLQARIFRLNVKGLVVSQYQQAGAFFVNEGKNILLTFLSAKAVIDGNLTLGSMLAVQYIIGQLNSPLDQLIHFLQITQDAKLSLDRLEEIHHLPEEFTNESRLSFLPSDRSISLQNIRFYYPGSSDAVLENISFRIAQGQTTAIVGRSGSGKTTLLKLLLQFYAPVSGEILVGEAKLSQISHPYWRSQCGAVLQDGYIFSDSVARNIALGDEYPDIQKLLQAVKIANVQGFIESLPLGYHTRIGASGINLSQGQKQRILIARAVYKDPAYLFFDEATNALDTENESIIGKNLEEFFIGRTVVVVAHRLSTVRNADQIIVLDRGKIIEYGTHEELTYLQGNYYQLVKNQLELGE